MECVVCCRTGFYGSAVCAFSQEAIDAAFNGTFKEKPSENEEWQRVDESDIPAQRPGDVSDDQLLKRTTSS